MMGFMNGDRPPGVTLANWDLGGEPSAWAYLHAGELLPTAAIPVARPTARLEIAEQAAPAEPDIAAAARAGREGTRDAIRLFFARLAEDGLLPAGTDVAWLADTASLLSQAQTYLLARDTLGWTSDEYQHWLATTFSRLISAAAGGN